MATHKIYFPWNIQKLKGLLADNKRQYNKDKFAFLSLIFVASIAIGIFAVNIIKLVNSETPVKIASIAARQEAVTIEKPYIKGWAAVPIAKTGAGPLHAAYQAPAWERIPIAKTGAGPLHTAHQTAPVHAAPIQTAPAPTVDITDRFTVNSYLYRAIEHEINGEHAKALASYKKILHIEENNFIVMNNISYIYLQLDLLKESIEYSIMATNINRDYVPALSNMGIVYAKLGDLTTAEYNFKRAIELEPENQDVISNLALFHEGQERFPEAAENYLKLVKMDNASGILGLARVYEKEGQITKAIMYYKKIYGSGLIDAKTRAYVMQRLNILRNNSIKTRQ